MPTVSAHMAPVAASSVFNNITKHDTYRSTLETLIALQIETYLLLLPAISEKTFAAFTKVYRIVTNNNSNVEILRILHKSLCSVLRIQEYTWSEHDVRDIDNDFNANRTVLIATHIDEPSFEYIAQVYAIAARPPLQQ